MKNDITTIKTDFKIQDKLQLSAATKIKKRAIADPASLNVFKLF